MSKYQILRRSHAKLIKKLEKQKIQIVSLKKQKIQQLKMIKKDIEA